MKKFWKNLCVCSMAVVSSLSLWACGKPAPEVSVDLDGDGVISAWETIFDSANDSVRQIESSAEVVEISDLAGLKAINDNTQQTKVYKLTKNINCNGEALSINLANSVLLGNNKVIKNFKLGDCVYKQADDQTDIPANLKGLFYNGVAIYDLRIFVGNQAIDLNNTNTTTIVSPLINVSNIENIEVRGKLKVNRVDTEGLSSNTSVDVSLLNAHINEVGVNIDSTKGLSIRKSTIVGQIEYSETQDTNARIRIGGAIPHNAKNGQVYDVNSNVDIKSNSSGKLYLGGIAGESDDMISTCSTQGNINFVCTTSTDNRVGGIVGCNNETGEIKNCSTSDTIKFNEEMMRSGSIAMYVGGITGYNYGIMSYVTSDANISINNVLTCQVGGIAGASEDAIISNVISRGSINLSNIKTIYVSEMIGVSKGGYYETAVVTTNINIDNSEHNSYVYLGMLTMFEDFGIDAMYNAEKAPNFTGILLGSKNTIYMRPSSNDNIFNYNLGLRNPFKYVVLDEDGNPKEEIRVDQFGNPVLDENDNEIVDVVTATRVPDVYSKLFYTTGYSVTKYNVTGDIHATEPLSFTYAKDSSNASIVSECSDSRLIVNFFVRNLGFKYGLNHSEIDLSNLALDQLKFTLSKTEHLTKYFEKKSYNGELIYFDRFIENECAYDASDEMFSLINSLIVSDKTNEFMPIKVSSKFAKSIMRSSSSSGDNSDVSDDLPLDGDSSQGSQDSSAPDDNEELTLTLAQNFGENIKELIFKMLNISPSIVELDSSKMELDLSSDMFTKYIRLSFITADYRYYFTFDVSQMVADENMVEDSYILYLHYQKVSKMMS